jgi:predicted peroxiredoxin
MEILYMTTSGASDPTKASIALHLAVNGSLEVGHTIKLVLAGDATELVQAAAREQLEGLGVPPFRELFAKAREHEVPVFV